MAFLSFFSFAKELLKVKMAKGMNECRNASQCERPVLGMWSQGMIKALSKRIKRLCSNLKPTYGLFGGE